MKLVFRTLLFLLSSNISYSQVFSNSAPDSAYFISVQIAKFPEIEKNRSGFVFFVSDINYYNKHIAQKADSIIQSTSSNYFFYKFRNNKHRYLNYTFTINEILYQELDNKNLSFTDTSQIDIYADCNERYWSWRSFKMKLRYLSTDLMYTGKIYSVNQIDSASSTPNNRLKIDSVGLDILKDNELYYRTIRPENFEIPYVFNDSLLSKEDVFNFIEYRKPRVEIGNKSKSIIFYFPIKHHD